MDADTRSVMKTDQWSLTDGTGTIHHTFDEVYCAARAAPARIDIIDRTGPHHPIRFVLWCSLRGVGVCDERCLGARDVLRRPAV